MASITIAIPDQEPLELDLDNDEQVIPGPLEYVKFLRSSFASKRLPDLRQ